jgi:hypothetical protein
MKAGISLLSLLLLLPTVLCAQISSAITAEQAAVIAANTITESNEGVSLSHSKYQALFTKSSVRVFFPDAGFDWEWKLDEIKSSDNHLTVAVDKQNTDPVVSNYTDILYDYGTIREIYRVKIDSFEQIFEIPDKLGLNGQDLAILGRIDSGAEVASEVGVWRWSQEGKTITVDDVKVFDAKNNVIPAILKINSQSYELIVDGVALEKAEYPVTIDPEIGVNDFYILGQNAYGCGALRGAITYNSVNNEYMVINASNVPGCSSANQRIFMQRLSANGAYLGGQSQISDARGLNPIVGHNPFSNIYIAVWSAGQIVMQRMNSTGTQVGGDTTISSVTYSDASYPKAIQ